MSGQFIALATKGVLTCPRQIIRKNVIPIKFCLKSKSITFDVKKLRDRCVTLELKKVETNFEKLNPEVIFSKENKSVSYKKQG